MAKNSMSLPSGLPAEEWQGRKKEGVDREYKSSLDDQLSITLNCLLLVFSKCSTNLTPQRSLTSWVISTNRNPESDKQPLGPKPPTQRPCPKQGIIHPQKRVLSPNSVSLDSCRFTGLPSTSAGSGYKLKKTGSSGYSR